MGELQTVDRSASQKVAGFSVKASSLFLASFLPNSKGQIPEVTGDFTDISQERRKHMFL